MRSFVDCKHDTPNQRWRQFLEGKGKNQAVKENRAPRNEKCSRCALLEEERLQKFYCALTPDD